MNQVGEGGGAIAQVLLLHLSSLMWGQTQQTGHERCDMREGGIVFWCVFKCTTADNYMCKSESEENQNIVDSIAHKIV